MRLNEGLSPRTNHTQLSETDKQALQEFLQVQTVGQIASPQLRPDTQTPATGVIEVSNGAIIITYGRAHGETTHNGNKLHSLPLPLTRKQIR